MPRPEVSTQAFHAERADFARLLAVVETLRTAPMAHLRDVDWIEETIGRAGLNMIDHWEYAYGPDAHLVNASCQGITQIPREFAEWLRLLADEEITSYLEIGCHNGGTATLATAYLHRFQPTLRACTVDIFPTFMFYEEVARLLPLEYAVPKTSTDFRGQAWDAVFIDGDHSFGWAWADYQQVGRHARVCGFHDIMCQYYAEMEELGGVTAVWELLRQTPEPGVTLHEFSHHPTGINFGIGARVRKRS